MNIDELRNSWKNIKVPPEYKTADTRDILSRMKSGKLTSLRDRLCFIHSRLIAVCVIGIFVTVPFMRHTQTAAVLAICLLVFLAVTHLRSLRRIRGLNFSQMTVVEAMNTICVIEEARIRQRAISLTLAIPVILFMSASFWDEYGDYSFYGCMVGAVFGAVAGIFVNRRAVAILREMKGSLNSQEQA